MTLFNFDSLKSCSFGVKNYFSQINSYLQLVPSYSFMANFKGFLTTTSRGEVLWTPGQGGSLIHPLQVITCHDVIDFSFYKLSSVKKIKKDIHERLYKNAKHIVFISDYSLEDFTNIFPSVMTERSVIRSPTIIKSNVSALKSPIGLDKFILVITNNLDHKNNFDIFCLAEMLLSRQVEFPIVVVGNVVVPKRFKCLLGKSLILLNTVSSKDLLGLQTCANVIISTSFIEGHNLPIAEGLGVGASVIASSIPVHKEYYQDLIEFYTLGNIDELFLKSMGHYREKFQIDKTMRCARTWESVANEYADLFNKTS